MSQKISTYFNWSTGKDSALAYYYLKQDTRFDIKKLVTSVNSHYDRVSMHGLRKELLHRQVQAIGLPLSSIELPEQPTMEQYETIMQAFLKDIRAEGFTHCGFGDIFLEDIRAYRLNQLRPFGISSSFPLWQQDTQQLIHNFLSLGFKAIVICTSAKALGDDFIGREIDESFISDIPKNVDPCGEHGEFHTFCYDGPIFHHPVAFTIGEKIYREYKEPSKTGKTNSSMGFWFVDLIPK